MAEEEVLMVRNPPETDSCKISVNGSCRSDLQ